MLHNNHIIKTLSNTILSTFLLSLIFTNVNVSAMACVEMELGKSKNAEKTSPVSIVKPTPPNPPFGK